MIAEVDAARTLPEKFEGIAGQVRGAIALLTPDDEAKTVRTGDANSRARQNVVMEIKESPVECSEALRDFIGNLSTG